MAKQKKAPTLPDPIVGEVAGNVLDEYASYSYSAKLYMIPPETNAPPGAKGPGAGGRGQASASKKGGYINNFYVADPTETVVLAQSGVTAGNNIDNITIENISKYDTGFETRGINFTITQPGAANFLDQILLARKQLGIPTFATDTPLFLEIVFQGYDEDIDSNEDGGMPYTHGPFRWRMHLTTISLQVTGEGSSYDVSCVPTTQIPYQDNFYRMPKNLSTTGSTVTEHLKDLIKGINDYHKNNNDKYQIVDEFKIDLSGLVGNDSGLKDEKLVTSKNSQNSQIINRQFNPAFEDMTPKEMRQEIRKFQKDEDSSVEVAVYKDTINVKKGISLYDYVCVLLSMNVEFFESATRTIQAQDPEKAEASKKKDAYTKWIKINAETEYIDFDSFRNVHAKKITYKPFLYKSVDERVQASPDENTLTKEETQARMNELRTSVFKSYHYLFSGRNDQIYECNIQYDNGLAFLLPPAGGTVGDVSVTSADLMTDTSSLDKDMTGGALSQKVLDKKNKDSVKELFNNASDKDIRGLGSALGFSNQELKDAIDNKGSVAALKIKSVLEDRDLLSQILQAEQAAKKKTFSDNQKLSDGSQYNPRASGYVYSADLVGNIADTINADTLWGRAKANANRATSIYEDKERNYSILPGTTKTAEEKEGIDPTDSVQPPYQQVHVVNELGESTFDGTTRQNLMGYYMQQKMEPSFLVNLEMLVKGDPWYLGAPMTTPNLVIKDMASDKDESNEEYVVFDKRDNVIMFDMQSPRLFDFNVDDEDMNEGYWSADGTAYFISGVYTLIKAISKFEGGEFKQDLSMIKLTSYQTSKLDRVSQAVDQHNESLGSS